MKFKCDKMTRMFHKVAFRFKDHLPQILIGTGIVTGGATVYFACRGTVKTIPAYAEANEKIENIAAQEQQAEENGLAIDADSVKQAKAEAYGLVIKETLKNFAPAVAFGTVSVTCVLAGAHILHRRNVAWAAAYATMSESFTSYRKNIAEKYGEDADKEAYHNVKRECEIDEETGEVTEKISVTPGSGYGRFFDEVCGANDWSRDPVYNYLFLRARQDEANRKLRTDGYLFLNDLYKMLGIDPSIDGQLVGWVYDENSKNGDTFVQIDVVAYDENSNAYMVNVGDDMPDALTDGMYIDFNVQGPIVHELRKRKVIREQ